MFEELLEKLAVELERRRVPYMIIGDQAVLAYGEPRLTRDFCLRGRSATAGKAAKNTAKEICFTSVEDSIIHKAVAGRARDWEDIRTVLLKNPAIDEAYVRRWLGEFAKELDRPLLGKFEEVQSGGTRRSD